MKEGNQVSELGYKKKWKANQHIKQAVRAINFMHAQEVQFVGYSLEIGKGHHDRIANDVVSGEEEGNNSIESHKDRVGEEFKLSLVPDAHVDRQKQKAEDRERWDQDKKTAIVLVRLVCWNGSNDITIVEAFTDRCHQ